MISSGQQCRITPEYVHIYRHLPVFKFSQSTLPDFSAPVPLNGFQPGRFLFPGGFPKSGQTDNSTFMRQDTWPCRMVSAVIHERLCLFIPVPFQSRFLRGVFSASRAIYAQSGRYPSGQAIQFSRCKYERGMAFFAPYTYGTPADLNVSRSAKK